MAKKKSFKGWLYYWLRARIKIQFKRATVRWRNFTKSALPPISQTQVRAIDLFYALLKNKETSLNYSPESKTRIIDSDFVWITLSSHTNYYQLNIIDETELETAHSHEVNIPKEYGFEMIDEFDVELEKRFRDTEKVKQKVVVDDLNKLIIKAQDNGDRD